MKYFVIKERYDETHVRITDVPRHLKRKYQLLEGISRLDGWHPEMTAQFSAHRPEGMILNDYVNTSFGWLLISGRFKTLLEDDTLHLEHVEYLPLKINNHKGRLASDDYWIVNFLAPVEGVDRERSVYQADAASADRISIFDALALREEVHEAGPPVFRLKEQPRLILVREDLVRRVEELGLTGMEFIDTEQYRTMPKAS